MKIKNKIRQAVSQVYNVLIPANRWNEYADLLDRDGHPNRKELCTLIIVFGKHIEILEDLVEDLYFQIELLEGKKGATEPQKEAFKLRTVNDIQAEMDKALTDTTEAFFVSPEDFKILEKNVNPTLAKTKPEYGYGKEINPRTTLEETCLYYKELPVFKAGL